MHRGAGERMRTAYNKANCQAHLDDCLWDAVPGRLWFQAKSRRAAKPTSVSTSTWGVTSFGDPDDKWVRTLPSWREHPCTHRYQ